MTVARAYKLFIKDRSAYCSAATLRTYNSHIHIFFIFLEDIYKASVDFLDFKELPDGDNIYSDFIIFLRSGNIKNTTIRSYCRVVKAFLKFCYENDICRDYLKKVKLPRDDSQPKMPLYTDEVILIDSFFDHSDLKCIRNYCIFHLMLDCGLRSQEVCHLKIEELDAARNLLYINNSKGCKSRITLAPDFVFEAVTVYLSLCGRSSGPVFLSLRTDKGITQNTIKQLFQDLKQQTGITRLHAHLLRHTFATSYLMGGGNMEFLRVFLGHTDYSVTQGYMQLAAQLKMLGADIYKLDSLFFTRGY